MQAKSVYVISDTDGKEIRVYKVDDTNLMQQEKVYYTSLSGPVGLSIDETDYGDFLFVTFEGQNEIELIDAKTMQYIDMVEAPDPYGTLNLAGIVVDKNKSKIYVINRRTSHLYVYSWDAENRELTLDLPDPYYVELEDCNKGYGLAFDYENDRLYVADNTTTVKCYDANDPNWSKLNDFTFTITDTAVGIAVDVNNQYIYTGSSQFGGSTYLTKYNLSTSAETRENVGSIVLGIAVDQDTSLVYITTFSGGTNPNKLMIYDSNLVEQTWDSGEIGNPAGLAVGSTAQYKPPLLTFEKTADINDANCVLPVDYIIYTIAYDANGHDVNDVEIIDYLPDEVDFNSASEPNVDYNFVTHTVTWNIGTVSAGDSNSVTVTVKVNELAEPNSVITSFCEIESNATYNTAEVNTPVCYWCGDIIYVDVNAPTDYNTGASWQNAYKDLQDALDTARNCECNEIWVAEGNYYPTDNPAEYYAAFNLENNLALYGGFAGTEIHLSQRNYLTNQTILSGDIDDNNSYDIRYLVKAYDVNQSAVIDGFTIKNASLVGIYVEDASPVIRNNNIRQIGDSYDDCGIYCDSNASPTIIDCNINDINDHGIYCDEANEIHISNCTIKQNGKCGIYSYKSSLNITNSLIKDNGADGIYANYGNIYTLADSTIENCIISGNKDNGIYCSYIWVGVDVQIKNNCIYENGADSSGHGIHIGYAREVTTFLNNIIAKNSDSGIYLDYGCYEPAIIRNNTIADNGGYGIYFDTSGDAPNIANCIIWNNDDDLENCSATYSCIKDNDTGQEIIHSDPCFVDDVNDNYHISPNSPCIDKGNTNLITDTNETDIDTEPRVWDGDFNDTDEVDIGADEVYYSPADFDSNNIVNFIDYAVLADTWWLTPADSNYNADCNLTGPNSIDSNDLRLFCNDWLWEPAWTNSPEEMLMMRAGSTTYMTTTLDSTSAIALYTPTPDQLLKFQPPQLDLEETIKWLEYLWLNDLLLREKIDEKQWLQFIKAVEDSFKDFLH